MTPQRDTVLFFIPTPDMGDEKGTWSSVDESWMFEHAREVQRMLPGGLMVMGIYFFCPTDQVGAKANMAFSTLRRLARVQSTICFLDEQEESEIGAERLFFHMCSKTRKSTCKAYNVKDSSKGSHPAELKGDVFSGFVGVNSSFHFSMSVSIPRVEEATKSGKLNSLLEGKVREKLSCISSCISTIDDTLVSSEPLVGGGKGGKGKQGKADKSSKGGAEPQELELRLFSPAGSGLHSGLPVGVGEEEEEGGGEEALHISGEIMSYGIVMGSESSIMAERAIKQDLVATISHRVSMLLEEWELQASEKGSKSVLEEAVSKGKASSWILPSRLCFPLNGVIKFFAHVMPGDSPSDALESLQQMLPSIVAVQPKQGPKEEQQEQQLGGNGMWKYVAVGGVVALYGLEMIFDFLPFI
ncbi:hypothetical protein GUITHDRAFT_116505 [Guillardia theta CCMP2712]|uniref:Protein odr-4 homolog n=1 Tax=Guillardia theta (strain CCMP2712) TaxID=905079 RepID=L1INB8_GUITC|nr:hypothetical protein GUITHDRAFT_116505 [Guillardia theta CCMP2712]EKX37389.1 hypothetical protein GUITHDRAFT_116505 [Guillardia theta CCMP2712]|eukprot:XP_005824369.1 hypothetical protein GUITHDRAFT_116505 [Guillardia theta CCMP2712]